MNPKGDEQKKCEGDAAQQVTSLPDLSLQAVGDPLVEQPNPTVASALGVENSEGKTTAEGIETSEGNETLEAKESAEAKPELKAPGENQDDDSSEKTKESSKAAKPDAEAEKKQNGAGGDGDGAGEKMEKDGNAAGITDDEKIDALKESPSAGKKPTGKAKVDSPPKDKSKTPEEQRSPTPVPEQLSNFRPKAKIASRFADRFGEASRRPSVSEDEHLEVSRVNCKKKTSGK